MTRSKRILISGASIAGPALAYWLARGGCEVTVVEQASSLRQGGQNIDVRATAREVLRLMNVEDAVRACNTGEVGTRFVDETGATVSEFAVDEREGSDGPTAELEILRGDLARTLVEACPEDVEWRFGDRIASLIQDKNGVGVEFDGGERERYDLVVAAEGVGSHTRNLVFGDEPEVSELGMYITYATIPRIPEDDDWWRFMVVPNSRQASLRPDNAGTMRAMLNFLADSPVLAGLDEAEARRALRSRFENSGWEVERILDGYDVADDLYIDWLRQVRCPTWYRGRVCLLGDAAWSVTSIGGGGTSLAIIGAYVLAAFLSQADFKAHETAFARFEEWMRPLVKKAQDLPPGVPRIAAPESRAGVQTLRYASKVAAMPLVGTVTERITAGPEASEELPSFVTGGVN